MRPWCCSYWWIGYKNWRSVQWREVRLVQWMDGPEGPVQIQVCTATPTTSSLRRWRRHRVIFTFQKGCTLWWREAREPKLRGYRRRFAYGYPERITEEKQVLAILNRKIVKQQIEFLPPIPDPFAKRRPREVKKAEWHTMYYWMQNTHRISLIFAKP